METIKDYDCIAEARKARAESVARLRGKTPEEKVRYLRNASREFEKAQREYRRQQQTALK